MSYTCFTYCVHPRKLQRSAGTYFPWFTQSVIAQTPHPLSFWHFPLLSDPKYVLMPPYSLGAPWRWHATIYSKSVFLFSECSYTAKFSLLLAPDKMTISYIRKTNKGHVHRNIQLFPYAWTAINVQHHVLLQSDQCIGPWPHITAHSSSILAPSVSGSLTKCRSHVSTYSNDNTMSWYKALLMVIPHSSNDFLIPV